MTHFGFKKLFGEEGSKDLLIDFLNQLLPIHHQIADLTFKNSENMSDTEEDRCRVSVDNIPRLSRYFTGQETIKYLI